MLACKGINRFTGAKLGRRNEEIGIIVHHSDLPDNFAPGKIQTNFLHPIS